MHTLFISCAFYHHQFPCRRRPDARALASHDLVLRATYPFAPPEHPHIEMPINKHLTLGTDHQGAIALQDVRAHLHTLNMTILFALRVHLRAVHPTGSVLA